MNRRLLFVDDEEVIRITLAAILRRHGFDVSVAATVAEALQKITSEKFDVLLSDLNIGNPGDGLTVVSAMRRTQPEAVTIILTGYPAFETALEAIRQQVDDYIVKPANVPVLVNTIESKLATPSRLRQPPPAKRVAMLLQEHLKRVEEIWVSCTQDDDQLPRLSLMKERRLQYTDAVLKEVIRTAQTYTVDGQTKYNTQWVMHDFDGYTPAMVMAEFAGLRRAIAQVVQENLLAVNLSYVIQDLARINECLDQQVRAILENSSTGTRGS